MVQRLVPRDASPRLLLPPADTAHRVVERGAPVRNRVQTRHRARDHDPPRLLLGGWSPSGDATPDPRADGPRRHGLRARAQLRPPDLRRKHLVDDGRGVLVLDQPQPRHLVPRPVRSRVAYRREARMGGGRVGLYRPLPSVADDVGARCEFRDVAHAPRPKTVEVAQPQPVLRRARRSGWDRCDRVGCCRREGRGDHHRPGVVLDGRHRSVEGHVRSHATPRRTPRSWMRCCDRRLLARAVHDEARLLERHGLGKDAALRGQSLSVLGQEAAIRRGDHRDCHAVRRVWRSRCPRVPCAGHDGSGESERRMVAAAVPRRHRGERPARSRHRFDQQQRAARARCALRWRGVQLLHGVRRRRSGRVATMDPGRSGHARRVRRAHAVGSPPAGNCVVVRVADQRRVGNQRA